MYRYLKVYVGVLIASQLIWISPELLGGLIVSNKFMWAYNHSKAWVLVFMLWCIHFPCLAHCSINYFCPGEIVHVYRHVLVHVYWQQRLKAKERTNVSSIKLESTIVTYNPICLVVADHQLYWTPLQWRQNIQEVSVIVTRLIT